MNGGEQATGYADDVKGFECTYDYNHSPRFFNEDPTRQFREGCDALPQARDAAEGIDGSAFVGGEVAATCRPA